MVNRIEVSPEAVSISDGPYRLIHPKGAWHVAGPLERFTERGTAGRPRGQLRTANNAVSSDSFAWIIRKLANWRREADKMDLCELKKLVDMAIFQTAMEWEGR